MTISRGRILCVEDDDDTRFLISALLTHEGFEVVTTADTHHVLALARGRGFDLYLLDNWMPGLSGPELTQKLRQFDTETPILFYSAAAFESDKEAARLAGAQGYVVKPAPADELIAEVVRLIG